MKNIQIRILNPDAIYDAERAMQAAATLTQKGEKITSLEDFDKIYYRDLDNKFLERLCSLPHPTLQKLGAVNVIIIGLSRRALGQITRHQNEVKFMSSSLQYSNYSGSQRFVIPPGLSTRERQALEHYYKECAEAYDAFIEAGLTPDQAGYTMPQALRGVLMISATPYQWKHMIGQRTCKRNTPEVRYIFLKIRDLLCDEAPELFTWSGPGCYKNRCLEGSMSCGSPVRMMKDELEALENED